MELRDRCFLALLRDGLYGVCSQESRELAANMDRVLQDQVLELARLHNLFPLLAQQMLLLNPGLGPANGGYPGAAGFDSGPGAGCRPGSGGQGCGV